MHLHFFATIETINGIQQGYEMFVHTKEKKPPNSIHISLDLKQYDIQKVVDSDSLFKVKKR